MKDPRVNYYNFSLTVAYFVLLIVGIIDVVLFLSIIFSLILGGL